jgi:hypothetical protein
MLAPVGAADSPGPAVNHYYSVAQNYTIRYYPRFLTYVQQRLAGYNRLVGPRGSAPCTASSYP